MKKLPEIKINQFQLAVLLDEERRVGSTPRTLLAQSPPTWPAVADRPVRRKEEQAEEGQRGGR